MSTKIRPNHVPSNAAATLTTEQATGIAAIARRALHDHAFLARAHALLDQRDAARSSSTGKAGAR